MRNKWPVGIAAWNLRDFDFPSSGSACSGEGESESDGVGSDVSHVDVNWQKQTFWNFIGFLKHPTTPKIELWFLTNKLFFVSNKSLLKSFVDQDQVFVSDLTKLNE